MDRILDLFYTHLAMSTVAIQFGLTGVLAAGAGLAWHRLQAAVEEAGSQPGG